MMLSFSPNTNIFYYEFSETSIKPRRDWTGCYFMAISFAQNRSL